jgi:hypothetical protein
MNSLLPHLKIAMLSILAGFYFPESQPEKNISKKISSKSHLEISCHAEIRLVIKSPDIFLETSVMKKIKNNIGCRSKFPSLQRPQSSKAMNLSKKKIKSLI